MIRRLLLCLCILASCLAVPAGAAGAKKKTTSTRSTASARAGKAAVKSSAKKRAGKTTAKSSAKKRSTARPKAASAPPKVAATTPERTVAAPRRLEDIHIEGEIPAPQVLFITARDQRRFTRFHHGRYLKSSVEVGESTLLPERVAVTRHPPAPAVAP